MRLDLFCQVVWFLFNNGIGQGLVAVAQMPSSAVRINGLRPAQELLDAAVASLNSGSMGPV